MAVDLNNLPLEAGDTPQVDFSTYTDPTEFAPPVPEGTVNFKTTRIEIEKFENGIVTFVGDHEAYDPNTGSKVGVINFDRFTTKVFDRQGVPASMAADMIRAVGMTDTLGRAPSPRAWGETVLSIKNWCDQGNFWAGAIQWDGYCAHNDTAKETVFDQQKGGDGRRPAGSKPLATQPQGHMAPVSLKGMKNWKVVGSGVNGTEAHYSATTPCPVCGNEIQARAKISRRIPR